MAFTPRSVIKTRVVRVRTRPAYITSLPYRCDAFVELPGGEVLASRAFHGWNGGRAVRAEAIAWAHAEAEKFARERQTAWQDVRASARSGWER
jgi:hypothetical protein